MRVPDRLSCLVVVTTLGALGLSAGPVAAVASATLADPYVIGSTSTTIEADVTALFDYSLQCDTGGTDVFVATLTVPANTFVAIDTGGSNFDTTLAIVENPTSFGGTTHGCSDDSPASGGTTSQVQWNLAANITYYVIVGVFSGSGSSGGHMVLHVSDRQRIAATITTPNVGSLIGGTVTCVPGAVNPGAVTGSVSIDGKPVPFSMSGSCTADGTSAWTTTVTAKKGKSYRVVTTISVSADSGNLGGFTGNGLTGSATTTLSAKVKAP